LLPPTIYAVCTARRGERLGSFGAEHAEPDNMHTLAAVIEAPTQRAYSAIRALAQSRSVTIAGRGPRGRSA
jgi:hypothetical protein